MGILYQKEKVSWLHAFLWCLSETSCDQDNSCRVHYSRKELRRNCLLIGHNNTKHFWCPIRSRHRLEFLEIVRWASVPRGSFAHTWKFWSCLFSWPEWLPLGPRGWSIVYLSFTILDVLENNSAINIMPEEGEAGHGVGIWLSLFALG